MTFVQLTRTSRVWALAAGAALAGTSALVAAPAPARAVVQPPATQGTLVASSSTTRLTGGVGLTDDDVYGETTTGIVSIPRAGSPTDWSPVTVEGVQLTGHLLQAEGDALLVADLDGAADTVAWRTDDDTWKSRPVPTRTTLGRGGLYALLPPVPAPGTDGQNWPVVDVRTGEVVASPLWFGPLDVAVDGSSLWTATTTFDSLVERSLPTDTRVREIPELGVLDDATLAVSGRWALLKGDVARVIDMDDVYADLDLGASTALGDLVLAARSSAWVTSAGTVAVRELAGSRSIRTYGPVRRTGGADLDADDAGTTLAYADPTGRVRLADLGWASAPGSSIVDHAAPPVPLLGIGARTVASTSIRVITFVGDDRGTVPFRPSGAAVELRYHQHRTGVSTFGPWTTIHSWRVDLVAPRATTTCFQARARDHAGNDSAWSATECAVVDGTAPHLTVHGPAPATKAVKGKATVAVSYEATDDTSVKNYDVRYAKAPKGSTTYGSWVYPASWQGTTAWSEHAASWGKSITITTGQRVCLSVRARDVAGNVSAWSSSRCTFADGTKPKLTRVVPPARWHAAPESGKVRTTIRFAGKDDHALRFDVRIRTASLTGRLGAWTRVATTTTKRSYSHTVLAGRQACYEVRARDTAGNVSAWSSPRCTNVAAPATSRTLHADHRTKVGHVKVVALKNAVPPRARSSWGAAIFKDAHARGIRLQVRTCTTCGTIQVQVGTKLVHVRTTAKKTGWKWVTLTWKARSGYIFFDEKTPYPHRRVTTSYIRSWTLIR